MSLMDTEPVVYIGTGGGIVSAVVVLIGSFTGLRDDQLAAIAGILLIIVPPVLAVIQRRYVSPVARVEHRRPDLPRP
jgi:uncharacterized membrane protein YdfJ with MMPL/SSD domain